ncbi:MAG: hypothetical protein R3275_06155 [Saprospiraceae bacterium]|nr:hypothetical protein [Saprospiraceae bacterium]
METYYFPLSDLEEGKVYVYESMAEAKLADEVWYYKSLNKDGETYLIGQFYRPDWRVQQVVIEKKTDLGMITDSVKLFFADTTGRDIPVEVDVINRAAFPFYRNPDDTLLYKIRWTDPQSSLEYTLDRRRIYAGDTSITFNGRSVPAIRFNVQEDLETFYSHDGATYSGWQGEEIYALDIGLVYYKKEIGDPFTKEFRLVEIVPGETFFDSLESDLK